MFMMLLFSMQIKKTKTKKNTWILKALNSNYYLHLKNSEIEHV